jgi:hypothetical protein
MSRNIDETTWRKLIKDQIEWNDESWKDVVSCTLTEEELDVKFDSGFGGSEGKPFTVWTTKSVYFPVVYDGAESVGCVSRNPDGQPTEHWGGE